ncbi:cell division protein ZapB [Leuconostoc falkenbergense]|uniref:cell division protein ZapB n=1 Tax=Leuconostoc falkenbergense TaxID=2766470 RepID=UPI0028B05737|nr:cell division protein ZapB [Leuconostoc falkenbergense]
MLYISNFFKNPILTLTNSLGLAFLFCLSQILPVFAKAKYNFSRLDIVYFVCLIISAILFLILFAWSIVDHNRKHKIKINGLTDTIQNLKVKADDNAKKIEQLKVANEQITENRDGLIQLINDLKQERNGYRSDISRLQHVIDELPILVKLAVATSDNQSVPDKIDQIVPMLLEETTRKDK